MPKPNKTIQAMKRQMEILNKSISSLEAVIGKDVAKSWISLNRLIHQSLSELDEKKVDSR